MTTNIWYALGLVVSCNLAERGAGPAQVNGTGGAPERIATNP